MDDLESLELLSLVSKVTSELQNHLGINDKTLAEFVIAQHSKCPSHTEFKTQMEGMGAEFPQSLVESIDRLILTMHPKHKGKSKGADGKNGSAGEENGLGEVDKKTRIFKGLAMPDKELPWAEEEAEGTNGVSEIGVYDDTFAMLEGLAGKSKEIVSGNGRKRGRSPEDDGKCRIRK